MAKTTWRFEFVDINKSITINEEESVWTGFAVIRAPKGTTQAMYVPPNNPQMIQTMFGYASADWPDLYEVLDFNNEYGVYISAPTANASEYPNYYGGTYLTKEGILNMYRVEDKKNPNYELALVPGKENIVLESADNSSFQNDGISGENQIGILNTPGVQSKIMISGVDSSVFSRMKYIDFNWSGKGVPFRYKLDKANNILVPDSSSVAESAGQKIVCGSFQRNPDTGKYDFILGGKETDHPNAGSTITMNTATDENTYGIPFIDFNSETYKSGDNYRYKNYMFVDGTPVSTIEDWYNSNPKLVDSFNEAIMEGGTIKMETGEVLVYDRPLKDCFHFVCDIEDIVYSYHVQPSPTANDCTLSFDNIVYDKWAYSMKLCYLSAVYSHLPSGDHPSSVAESEMFNKTLTTDGNLVLAYTDRNQDSEVNKDSEGNVLESLRIYKWVQEEDDDGNALPGKWVDVTSDYETETVLAFEALDGKKDDVLEHNIYKVGTSSLTKMTEDSKDREYKLSPNVLYNSYYCKATEEDSEGEIHESGAFTGSLDEFGTDENGTDNYWQELIPPGDSVVFAEPYIVRTFDKDLDSKGIYTGKRIEGPVSTVVHGQRYVDFVVNKNIKEGKTGGECTTASEGVKKRFARIIKEGLIEATKPKYEDCSIFMEFSGLDTLKSYLGAIRTSHYTATIITPKNVTSIANCRTFTVSGRFRGTAQYCQELLYKDRNLRKKYYACPIGAVGVMLMRIMENYLGGVAPMWMNEGSVGGQISDILQRSPIEARWDFTDTDTKILDSKGINPILMDEDDGVMIVSQKTTEQNAGDWSSLGHQMSFDLCKREIRDNVMKPQIGKKISPHWINKRQNQVNNILEKRTGGDDPIWSYASSDIKSVNTDYTRAQGIFNIPVEVRVYPFSEKVRLTFTNLSQLTVVSEN